ncbi:hypothetical protein PAHAL_2G221600 [Panicum hallii]|uniref:Uncharacterized protein n=1 Tax=Panicum hallii TaxID=206008 RepID=A0A2T8KPY7_9POAL|nr:pollen-specific leucine-rich repeat extensin-like protein 3 [Panicum hallii]PVH64248.1 hypothetical protein PAHAL_2G221600 [Panicum hallii]
MSSACPSFTFSCSNISCSIWFCCGGGGGGSSKEPEQDSVKQYQAAHPQPMPPQPQVITVPDHLRPISEQQPPELPPTPPPAAAPAPQATTVHARPPPQTNPPHHVPSTETYYLPPPSTQQQSWPQTLLPPALPLRVPAPPKVHDPWPPSTQIIPSEVQPTMMHKPAPQPAPVRSQAPPLQAPWPSRQPSKTYQALPPEQQHPAPPRLPFKTYQAALPPQALPPGPLVDSMPLVGYYPQEHPEYFDQET